MRLVYFSSPTKQDTKLCGCKIHKDCLTLALVVNMTSTNKLFWKVIFQQIMRGGLQTEWPG